MQTAIPIVLRHLTPDGKSASSLPFDGRRLSSFTDSRQGTARFAAKMQLETERDFVRSLLYHSIADRERPTDHQELDERRQKIVELEQVVKEKPTSAVLAKVLCRRTGQVAGIVGPYHWSVKLAGSPAQAPYQ